MSEHNERSQRNVTTYLKACKASSLFPGISSRNLSGLNAHGSSQFSALWFIDQCWHSTMVFPIVSRLTVGKIVDLKTPAYTLRYPMIYNHVTTGGHHPHQTRSNRRI